MSPPLKGPIPNQDIDILITEKDTSLPPITAKILLDINNYLMIGMVQILQNTTLTILQIIHVTRMKIL